MNSRLKTTYRNITKSIHLNARLEILLAFVLTLSLLLLPLVRVNAGGSNINPKTGDASWTLYTVDGPKYFTNMRDRSLVYDTNGKPHVAYGGEHLYYAFFNGSNWEKTIVDPSPQVGQYASLALDADNNPRIAYYDAANRALKFAYRNNNIWFVQTIENAPTVVSISPVSEEVYDPVNARLLFDPGSFQNNYSEDGIAAVNEQNSAGMYTSITIAKSEPERNVVHISYYSREGADGILKYARWDGLSWTIEDVDFNNTPSKEYDVGQWTSIALDADHNPVISYMSEKHDNLKYAHYDGTDWELVNVSEELGTEDLWEGSFTSLVFDGSGNPHISYLDFSNEGNYKLRHAYKSGNKWYTEVVDKGNGIGWYTSIARDSNGKLTISYYDAGSRRLKYATKNGDTWSVKTFNDDFAVGEFTSTAFDPNNLQGITFYSPANGGFYYRHWTGSEWEASLIDESADVGKATSLDISNGSFPRISYFNAVGGDLKYASSTGNLWYTKVIAGGNWAGEYSSLKLDVNSRPHIAYYEATHGDLKYITWNGYWGNPVIIDSGVSGDDDDNVDVGQYVSLAIDNIGKFHISYYDSTNGNLKYARWDGSNWITTPLDTAGNVGQFTSIALDTANKAYIAYYDADNKDLKFAYLSPTNVWIYEVVDSVGDVGQYASLAISPTGQPQIAYYDADNKDLKFAYKTGSTWNVEVVESAGDMGMYASLAIDNSLVSHVSYYDATNHDLKYAKRVGASWSSQVVDSGGDVGLFTSLALTPSGEPGISYYDQSNYDLKFAASFTLPSLLTTYVPMVMK
jgi:hypothetical protein